MRTLLLSLLVTLSLGDVVAQEITAPVARNYIWTQGYLDAGHKFTVSLGFVLPNGMQYRNTVTYPAGDFLALDLNQPLKSALIADGRRQLQTWALEQHGVYVPLELTND